MLASRVERDHQEQSLYSLKSSSKMPFKKGPLGFLLAVAMSKPMRFKKNLAEVRPRPFMNNTLRKFRMSVMV